ncbi:MAG: glucose-1-phosphate thymidylyltransferase [Candidatus Schekmanbacteria bacterium]|nr:glucose-1-phosphate thymidylyltransferase [Candidatus Schekmanbacteria bacterium]
MLSPASFFKNPSPFEDLFEGVDQVWQIISRIASAASRRIAAHRQSNLPMVSGTIQPGAYVEAGAVIVAADAVIETGAYVKGPTIIGPGTVVRHGAYVRGDCLIGASCVVGHATELKNVLMFDHAKAPHFNYVGDSVLGCHVNLGAGTKVSNMRVMAGNVTLTVDGTTYDSGLRKFGAIVGDDTETGCNSVLNPGTLLGPGSIVYPCALCWGYYAPESLVKVRRTVFATTEIRSKKRAQTP